MTGSELRALRLKHKYTRKQFAKILHIPSPIYRALESEKISANEVAQQRIDEFIKSLE